MQTRLQQTFANLTFNEAGMMTRRQKATFDRMYNTTARTVQERKMTTPFINKVFTHSWNDWVSPSRFYDYFQEDEFMYVVKNKTGKEKGKEVEGKERYSMLQNIFDEGKLFEEKVFEFYRKQFSTNEIVQIAPGNDRNEVRSKKMRKKTIQEMKKGTPIILQGILWNEELRCYGAADMIVRSDYLHCLVDDFEPDDEIHHKAPNLKGNYHYRVVDIKNKKLHLLVKNEQLADGIKYRYPKAQLWFYNYEVSRIQGFNSHISYVLGKKVVKGSGKNEVRYPTFNYKFGEINYRNEMNKKYESEVRKCIEWMRESRKYTLKKLLAWTSSPTTPLPRVELYPNMRREWNEHKLNFAEHIGEISSLYRCGRKQRELALNCGVSSYHDERCTPKLLGFKEDSSYYRVINSELELIRRGEKILPTKEEGLTTTFFNKSCEFLASIDMEFLLEHDYDTLPSIQKECIVYMIGFGIRHLPTGKTYTGNFTASELTVNGEREMLHEFIQYLNQLPCSIEILHWNYTEEVYWNKLMSRHPDIFSLLNKEKVKGENNMIGRHDTFCFTDMLPIFRDEPIMVKDTHGFSLKPVCKNLIKWEIIQSKGWEELNCTKGGDTIAMIKEARKRSLATGKSLHEIELTKEIEKYNQADCNVLLDLFEGIRNYYSS